MTSTEVAFSGEHSMLIAAREVGDHAAAVLTLSNLAPGAEYVVSMHIYSAAAQAWTYITSDYVANNGPWFEDTGGWLNVSYTYVPATESGLIFVQSGSGADVARLYVDAVTLTRSAWTETVVIPEQGHYEPQPDVWVVDSPAWTEPGQPIYGRGPDIWIAL